MDNILEQLHVGALVKFKAKSSLTGRLNPDKHKFHKIIFVNKKIMVEGTSENWCCGLGDQKALCYYHDDVKQVKLFSSNPELVKEKL